MKICKFHQLLESVTILDLLLTCAKIKGKTCTPFGKLEFSRKISNKNNISKKQHYETLKTNFQKVAITNTVFLVLCKDRIEKPKNQNLVVKFWIFGNSKGSTVFSGKFYPITHILHVNI